MSRVRLIALLLALVTLVVYLPVAGHDFLSYDDDEYVTGNPAVQLGLTLAGVRWAFTTFYAANWHPLTWLSHMADCELFGLNPVAHHLVNVLFHSANAALLFVLLCRLTDQIWPSALVAGLFAWHPLHVESVAWVAERKDVLSTCLALLSLLAYARYAAARRAADSRAKIFYAASLGFFALGLMAKPMLVSLPGIMLLLDFWPLQRFSLNSIPGSLVLEKVPFFLLTAAACVMTLLAQGAGHTVISIAQLPVSFRLENSAVSTVRYLLKMFWPANLAVIYPPALIPRATWVLALAAVILISTCVWLARRRSPCWLVGWLWFLGTLLPVIGLVQVGGTTMADRYTYVPSIGIFMALAFGLHELAGLKKYFPIGSALLLGACVVCTERQLSYWRNSETLFRHTLAVTRNNEFAHLNLGVALEQQGRTAGALAEYREGLQLNLDHYQIRFVIGNLLEKTGQPAAALVEYRVCLQHDPNSPAFHNAAGCAFAAQGEFVEAFQEFAAAKRLDPGYEMPHLELARIFFARGQDSRAVLELGSAVQAAPEDVQTLTVAAHYLAANQETAARDGPAARSLALKANDLSGGRQPEVCDVLGMAFAATGDFSNAVICARNALSFATATNLKNTEPIRQRLEFYQHNQPWRESFRATNAPPAADTAR